MRQGESAQLVVLEGTGTASLVRALAAAHDAGERATVVLGPAGAAELVAAAARESLLCYDLEPDDLRRLGAGDELVVLLLDERAASQPRVTAREREVLELVREGLTNGAIGNRLGISPRTVQKHLRNVYDKLGVRTRAGAVTRAALR